MTRLLFGGFELATLGGADNPEGTSTGVESPTFDSTIKRTGSFSLKCGTSSNSQIFTSFNPTVGAKTSRSWFFAFYKTANPSVSGFVFTTLGTAGYLKLSMFTTGAIRFEHDVNFIADSSALANDTWHTIEIRQEPETGVGPWSRVTNILVNGVSIHNAAVSFNASSTNVAFQFRNITAGNGTVDLYYDDFVFDEDVSNANGAPTAIGNAKVVLMLPLSDAQVGSWTGGAGGTTNLYDAVNNTPPIGTASETNLTQIESADNSGDNSTDEYRANLGSYITAGVGASDTVKSLSMCMCHGEDVNTGTKTLYGSIVANPNFGASTVNADAGNNVGALGTFPTNWVWTTSISVIENPSVTLGSDVEISVRKSDTGTRVASVCALGLYVEFAPGVPQWAFTPAQYNTLLRM